MRRRPEKADSGAMSRHHVLLFLAALCLALAAFARSTKEGQYYLMPLLLVVMPLAVLPTAPGVDLTLGNSLIPVTGIVKPRLAATKLSPR